MKVKELIEKLATVPGDYVVLTEGCDCIGDVVAIEVAVDDSTYNWKTHDRTPRPSVMLMRKAE